LLFRPEITFFVLETRIFVPVTKFFTLLTKLSKHLMRAFFQKARAGRVLTLLLCIELCSLEGGGVNYARLPGISTQPAKTIRTMRRTLMSRNILIYELISERYIGIVCFAGIMGLSSLASS